MLEKEGHEQEASGSRVQSEPEDQEYDQADSQWQIRADPDDFRDHICPYWCKFLGLIYSNFVLNDWPFHLTDSALFLIGRCPPLGYQKGVGQILRRLPDDLTYPLHL